MACQAAPRAEFYSPSWQLDFKFHDPQRILVQLPGEVEATPYWYVVYEVTNNTGRDIQFYPSFQLVTDELEVVEGGAEISPSVYQEIKNRHKVEFPFLAEPTKVTGALLQAEENSRASMVVFRELEPEASAFTIYAAGLSGEIAKVRNPKFDASKQESEQNPRFFVLRRTLAITYQLPGDWATVAEAIPLRQTREWVMR